MKLRQLKMDYDELKFQFQRYKVFKTSKQPQFQPPPELYAIAEDIQPQLYQSYKPTKYKPLMETIPSEKEIYKQVDPTTAAQSMISDSLYRKNMESSVGDLLRWDSTKGTYAGMRKPSEKHSFHNKTRSVSNPPAKQPQHVNFSPNQY